MVLPDATARWGRVVVVAVPGRAMRRERFQQDARTAGVVDGVEGGEEVVRCRHSSVIRAQGGGKYGTI